MAFVPLFNLLRGLEPISAQKASTAFNPCILLFQYEKTLAKK